MNRLAWFKHYFKGSVWHGIYLILAAHTIVFLTRYVGVRPEISLSMLLLILFTIPLAALYQFLKSLISYSNPKNHIVIYPNDTFTLELVKTVPYLVTSLVFLIPVLQALIKYHFSQNIPITFTTYAFIYAYSINFWLFFQMSRLLIKNKEK